jgi:RNA polymerase sigma-70 factor (ECF subfamily)
MDTADRVWRDRGLRSAVLAGDGRAWQTWYEESFDGLYTYVSWRCAGRRDLTDEVVQETWLTAVRRIRSFNPEQAGFAAWLRGIAANVLRNHFRKRRTAGAWFRPLGDPGAAPDIRPAAEPPEERAERIGQALAGLSERHEAVLRAKYLDQHSVAQIAANWNETPKTIESLLTRARLAFREAYLKLECSDEPDASTQPGPP